MSKDSTELPSSRLAGWLSEISADLGWEGSVDANGFCAFASKDDAPPLVVQADDRMGIVRFSSEVLASAPEDPTLLSNLLSANFRGIGTGIAQLSMHPETRSVHLEMVWSDSDRGGLERFAVLVETFNRLAANIRQSIAQGTLPDLWRHPAESSEWSEPSVSSIRV